MNGVELTSSELAYLLATLDCREVPGLEDPALFPGSASAQGKAYKKGRQELEKHGWIKPVPKQADEYELDALLLEAVSVLAAPDYMIASNLTSGEGDSQMLFHYLSGEETVEFCALDKKLYWLGALATQEQVADRVSEMMQLGETEATIEAEIEAKLLEDIKALVEKGKTEDAKSALDQSDLDDEHIQNVLESIEHGSRGSLVAVEVDDGEITSGRRFNVYGSGASAWMSFSPSADSSTVILTPCNTDNILEFINHFIQ